MDARTVHARSNVLGRQASEGAPRRPDARRPPTRTGAEGPRGGTQRRRHAQRDLLPLPLTRSRRGTAPRTASLLTVWSAGKAAHTIRAYRHDLEDFAFISRALGVLPALSVTDALSHLLRQSSACAHEVALGFQCHLRAAQLSPASINRHLASLRSVTKLARTLGMVTWYLEVASLRHETRNETRVPTSEEGRGCWQPLAVTPSLRPATRRSW